MCMLDVLAVWFQCIVVVQYRGDLCSPRSCLACWLSGQLDVGIVLLCLWQGCLCEKALRRWWCEGKGTGWCFVGAAAGGWKSLLGGRLLIRAGGYS